MRIAVALTALFLTMIVTTSCATSQEPERPSAVTDVNPLPSDTETPTVPPTAAPTATSEPAPSPVPTPQGQNVALSATGRASAGEGSVQMAFDGDPDSVWSSENHPAQWITVALDGLYLVERIDLVVAQAPAGPTTHVIWLDNGSGVRTLFRRLTDIHTEDGQTLTVEIDPPRPIREILLLTLDSPSWVAWREARVFGSLLSAPGTSDLTPQLRLEKMMGDLVLPVQVTHAGDGSGRLFVVEQQGRIHIVKNGAANEALFLDISSRVGCCEERGLFNIAFPPTFPASRQFYLSYSNLDDDTVISRFTVSDDADIADPGSEEPLLNVSQPHHQHNGGRLSFGPSDGYLYIGLGDGGSDGRPADFGQDPALLLGKILRIDVESEDIPYGIPASNPFVGAEEYRDEIWAIGFRNPWGFAFDGLTGEFYIPDTGHNDREELNYVPASSVGGENYGWPTIEGTRCPRFTDLPVPCSQAGIFALPVAEYDHTRGCAIVGGAVYRGKEFPQLAGQFLFADFCRGDIWSLKRTESGEPPLSGEAIHPAWQVDLVLKASVPVSSIGEDEEGNLYVTGYQDGSVYMLTQD